MHLLFVLLCSLFAVSATALELRGHFIQGGLVFGQVEPSTQVRYQQQEIKVSPEGVFVIGFGRDAKLQQELQLQYKNGEQAVRQIAIKAREYAIQRIEGIDKKIMSPSVDKLERIRSEAAQVRAARAESLERKDFFGVFQWPLRGPISGVYGSQRVYNGVPKRPHYGVDVAAKTGTPVTTPAPGIVTLAHPDMFYSGGTVIIDHGYGVSSTLMHLSKLHVELGQELVPGDLVAEVGAGGRATGPHLDWRMNWFKVRVDPQLLVPTVDGMTEPPSGSVLEAVN